MNLLLDTHVAIRALAESHTLPDDVRAYIGDDDNDVWVSVASLWEIAIKFSRHGRARIPLSATEALAALSASGYRLLQVREEHVLAIERHDLPSGDPFDRLILAQALSEPLHLITKDRRLAAYSDSIISW